MTKFVFCSKIFSFSHLVLRYFFFVAEKWEARWVVDVGYTAQNDGDSTVLLLLLLLLIFVLFGVAVVLARPE